MAEIKITVSNKVASVEGTPQYVCGNSDYFVIFTFDDEWAGFPDKTARFIYYADGLKKFIDKEFSGNTCNIPVILNTELITVGVYADGIKTTTGADVRCKKSILCEVDKEEQDLFEMGKNSAPNPLKYAKKLVSVFDGTIFPDNYELTIEAPLVESFRYAFRSATGLNKLTLKGQNSNIIDLGYAFQSSAIIEIDLTEFTVSFSDGIYAFNTSTLVNILGELDFSSATRVDNMFRNCISLEEIRIKANTISLSINFSYSNKLSAQSVQSIINGLATVETKQTLTLNANTTSRLTDEQMTQITNKNWVVM